MNRIFSIFLMAVLAFSASMAASVVTFDFSTAEGITAMGYDVPEPSAGTNLTQAGPVTVGGVTLSATDGATATRIWNSQGSYTLRIYVDGSITLSVGEGSITGITVNAANTSNFDLIADVGDYSADGAVGAWTGSATAVTLTHVGSKNAQVASLVVTTSGDGPEVDPEDPIDPNIFKLDSLQNLASLKDGTPFQFMSDVYVNYQWHENLWVMQLDAEGNAIAGIIYGDTGKEYRLGSVIPAGWTAVKSTFKSLVEATEPAHFANAKDILSEDMYSAFDCTGYVNEVADPEEDWTNYKVSFDGVRLSEIDNRGMFTIYSDENDIDGTPIEATMTGFNKFGIEYPEVDDTERYSIEGMMSIYNGTMELFPISITSDPGTRLWKVLYAGEDGAQYKLNDTLLVVAASDAADGKLIYVTDNVDQVYYDLYADWGYAEWMAWYPNWIALDCSGAEELFAALTAQQALAPGTIKGKLQDRLTNPRLVLNGTPQPLAMEEYPMVTLFDYDLSQDHLAALGHEVGRIEGYFYYKDGVPCLCSEQDTVVVKLNFDYAPELEAQMASKQGYQFALLSVFKLDEVWDENAQSAPARRISAVADDYFTNYTVYPLQILSNSSVSEVASGRKPIGVKYVSPSGVSSSAPHDGVNIVVTTYGDGSTTTVKRVVK